MSKWDWTYWSSAFNWQESVSPKITSRVFTFVIASIGTTYLCKSFPELNWSVGVLEASGVVLGLLLVIRTNSGYDRWWEARKLWGGIVNQSRNLAITGLHYGPSDSVWQKRFISYVVNFPFKAAQALRGEIENYEAVQVSSELSRLVGEARRNGQLQGFEFEAIENQRALLIDYIGACERILKTPIPRVLDIKVRRFLTIYLFLVPLGISQKMGWFTPIIILVLSYPLLALDQIGIELQNPFSRKNLSSLPLNQICEGIKKVVDHLVASEDQRPQESSEGLPAFGLQKTPEPLLPPHPWQL